MTIGELFKLVKLSSWSLVRTKLDDYALESLSMPLLYALARRYSPTQVCNINFNYAMTAVPQEVTALNGSYTRNSVKNVLQGTSLVQLAANQFGTSYDPATGLYGYVSEPAATNLALYSEGDVSNWGALGVTNAASTFFGAGNAFYFVGGAIAERSIKQSKSTTSGTTYVISTYVIMDDLSTPVVGTSTSTGDFLLLGDATVISSPALVESCGGGVYRVSSKITSVSTGSRLFGIYKMPTQSAKGFRATRIQIETGVRVTSYILTTSASATRAADFLAIPLWKNNLAYSDDPTGTGWTRSNVTLTAGQADNAGGTTAIKVEATTTAATTLISTTTKAPSTTVTASVLVKAGTGPTTLSFILRNNTTTTDFTQGVFTTATGAISGAGWTSVADGNGYYKLTFTQSTGITVGDTLWLYVGFAGNSFTAGYNFYYCAPQINPGSSAMTYVPTTSTLDVAGNANISGFNSAYHTLAVDIRKDVTGGTSGTALASVYADFSNKTLMYISNAGGVTGYSYVSGATAGTSAHLTPAESRAKYAMSYVASSAMVASGNGAAKAVTGTPAMPANPLIFSIGNSISSTPASCYIFRAQLIPAVLTQAQLNGITS